MPNGKLKAATGDWVVVCDGRKALILENAGDREHPNLRTHEVFEHEDRPTREQGTDSPGRVHQSVGTARSAVEQTDWQDLAEQAFLKKLAERIDGAVREGATKHIILVAAPRALGMIRPFYTPALGKAIVTEIGKDLVKLPVHEIERQLFS